MSSSALEVIVASKEGRSGGRVCEDEGSRRGVDVVEFSVEGGRTRFARRKEKNAVGGELAVGFHPISCTMSTRLQASIPERKARYENTKDIKYSVPDKTLHSRTPPRSKHIGENIYTGGEKTKKYCLDVLEGTILTSTCLKARNSIHPIRNY